ncbi:hypothetical protein Cflav_PD3101 [Pedosphaera parvula Ellin514]|uniref:Uncharacterized protein n=1 Tax=Pedosphaera parvula (strain Ellin514) TaxID=320771 RepID=B9XJI1_PEDPL|nr:hypothetical protein Cflav_PD3101 [Pedosphaera parvula Ellin514]
MPAGNNISEANRLQASSPVDVTESGPSPSRSIQVKNPAQASAANVKAKTETRAARDAERKIQMVEQAVARIRNQKPKIMIKSMCVEWINYSIIRKGLLPS